MIKKLPNINLAKIVVYLWVVIIHAFWCHRCCYNLNILPKFCFLHLLQIFDNTSLTHIIFLDSNTLHISCLMAIAMLCLERICSLTLKSCQSVRENNSESKKKITNLPFLIARKVRDFWILVTDTENTNHQRIPTAILMKNQSTWLKGKISRVFNR